MSPLANIMLARHVTVLLAVLLCNIVQTRALAMVTPLGDRMAQRLHRAEPVSAQDSGLPG